MKKFQLLLFLTIVVLNHSLAQESYLVKDKEVVFSAGLLNTKITNKNISHDDYKLVDNKLGYNLSFQYSKYYKNKVGVGIGVDFSNFKQVSYQKGLFEITNQTDIDGNKYDSWINSKMTYTTTLKYVEVPVMFHLIIGKGKQLYGVFDAGIVNSFLIAGKCAEKGTIEYMGKYATGNPFFNVVSQNNSHYDYRIDYIDKSRNDGYGFYNLSFRTSFGIDVTMSDNIYLKVAPVCTIGFLDITGKDYKGKAYVNVLGNTAAYEPTKAISYGLNMGIACNL